MISIEFLLTSLIVVLIPGTGVLFTVTVGLCQGRRAGGFAAIGCTLGIVPHLLATILGLAAVLHTSALAFQTLKYTGVAYLLFIAYGTWKDREAFRIEGEAAASSAWHLMAKAVALNVLNPKLTIFFLAFLPQFLNPADPSPLAQLLILSGIFMAMTLVVFAGYGVLAHGFRQVVLDSPRVQAVLRQSFAAAFAGLAVELALAKR